MSKAFKSNLSSPTRLIVIASGKAGVGKTVCAANIALQLAKTKRVLAVDINRGRGSLNTALGVRALDRSIHDFLQSDDALLGNAIVDTAIPSLKFLGGAYGQDPTSALSPDQASRLLESLRAADVDFVVLDLGDATDHATFSLFAAANLRILVTTAESLARHDDFAFIKSFACGVMLAGLDKAEIEREKIDALTAELQTNGSEEIATFIERTRSTDPASAATMERALTTARVSVILNKASGEEGRANLQRLVLKSTGLNMFTLGAVPYDENINQSVSAITDFVLKYKDNEANAAFEEIAQRTGLAASGIDTTPYDFNTREQRAAMIINPNGATTSGSRGSRGKLTSVVGGIWQSVSGPFRARPYPGPELEYADSLEGPDTTFQSELLARKRAAPKEKQEIRNWFSERESSIRQLESDLLARDEYIQRIESQLRDSKQAEERTRADLDSTLKSVAEQRAQLEATIAERNDSTSVQETDAASLAELHARELAALEEKEEIRNLIGQRESSIRQLESDLLARDEHILRIESELRDSKQAEERTPADLAATIESAAEQRAQLEATIAEREAQIAELLHQLSDRTADEQKEHLIQAIGTREAAINHLTLGTRTLKQKIAELEDELAQTTDVIQSVSLFRQKWDRVQPTK